MRKLAAVLVVVFGACLTAQEPLPFRYETAISAPELGPVRETGGFPQVATSGDGYVATWTDMRGGEPRVYAARFKQDGTMLDRVGIRIAPATFAGSIVWNGSAYVLIYGDKLKIYSRTLTADGFLGTPNVILERTEDAEFEIHAATNGTSILAVGAAMPGLVLDLQGRKQREINFTWQYAFHGVEVASAGGKYLVVAGNNAAYMQSVDANGTLGPMLHIATLQPQSDIGVATDGTHFLIVWSDDNVRAMLVDGAANALGPIQTLSTNGGATSPAVAWRNGEYFVTYDEEHTFSVFGIRVSSGGLALATPQLTTGKSDRATSIATNGTSGVTVWRARNGAVEAGLFDSDSLFDGDPLRSVLTISRAAHVQFDVKLARLHDNTPIAAWIESTTTGSELRLSRSPGSIAVQPNDFADRLIDVVVLDDTVWVLYSSHTSIYARRFTSTLHPIDEHAVRIATSFDDPGYGAAAAGNGVILVAYAVADPAQPNSSNMGASLLRDNGATIEIKPVEVQSNAFDEHLPAIAWDARNEEFQLSWARAMAKATDAQPAPAEEIVSLQVRPLGFNFPFVRTEFVAKSPIVVLFSAPTPNGVAMTWQTADDFGPSLKYAGEPAESAQTLRRDDIEESDDYAIIGALEAHGNDLLLVLATNGFAGTSYVQEMEVWTLTGFLQVRAKTPIGTFETHNEWRAPDVDILGGVAPMLAYTRFGSEGEFGGVSRVFVQQTGGGRKRSVRNAGF